MSKLRAESEEVLEQGQRRVRWTQSNLRLLNQLEDEFRASEPFMGLTIGVSLHIEPKTAVLLSVLQARRAKVVATGNLGTTQADVAQALIESGIPVYGDRTEDHKQHRENVRQVLRHKPNLLLDNGADLLATLLESDEFSPEGVLGGTEETTSGGNRLRQDFPGRVPFPVIVINDSPLKLIVENKHAVGQSVVESFMRITNLMIPGRRFVLLGYGWCGRGIAQYLRSLGGQVAVVEPDVIRALEAAVDGFRVSELEALAAWGNVFITATGQPKVLRAEHFKAMPEGAVLANAGHFDWEIDVEALRELAVAVQEPEDAIEEYTLPSASGKHIRLIAGGRMFNLAGREPKGNSIESMDMGFALQALSLALIARRDATLIHGPQAVPQEVNLDAAGRMLAGLMNG
jgi:adenosylhomocysteinase